MIFYVLNFVSFYVYLFVSSTKFHPVWCACHPQPSLQLRFIFILYIVYCIHTYFSLLSFCFHSNNRFLVLIHKEFFHVSVSHNKPSLQECFSTKAATLFHIPMVRFRYAFIVSFVCSMFMALIFSSKLHFKLIVFIAYIFIWRFLDLSKSLIQTKCSNEILTQWWICNLHSFSFRKLLLNYPLWIGIFKC